MPMAASGYMPCSSLMPQLQPQVNAGVAAQALCCMTKGCLYATIRKTEETIDYGVYYMSLDFLVCFYFCPG